MHVWLYVFAHTEKIYKRIKAIVYSCYCCNLGRNRVFNGKGLFAFNLCTYKIVWFLCFPFTIRHSCFCNLFSWNVVLGYNSLTSTWSYGTLQTLPSLIYKAGTQLLYMPIQSCFDNQNGIKILKAFFKV